MPSAEARLEAGQDSAVLAISGDWREPLLPDSDALVSQVSAIGYGPLIVDLAGLGAWDSRLNALLLRISRCREDAGEIELRDAPEALQRLHRLAITVPRHRAPAAPRQRRFSLRSLRKQLAEVGEEFLDSLAFLGAAVRAVINTLLGRARMRREELVGACFQAGPDALGIVALTSVLVGMILAYLGAAQLQQFGAALYVADLVAIGMLREIGALMTAVVMAGRTGAAYAAQLSSMQANEEIDAISTLGMEPMEFLVAPRIIALVVMMPLLVVFSDALGIVGGAIVAGSMGVTPLQFIGQLQSAGSITHLSVGLFKAVLFALLIALAGCRAGMNSGRNSAAVGRATTDAVVTSVVYLIIADAAVNILCQQLEI